MDVLVNVVLVATTMACLLFIYGLSTRTRWWRVFCGVGYFLMAIPVGGALLCAYMFMMNESLIFPFDEDVARLAISGYVFMVVTGFTVILYKRNVVQEVQVVKEEVVKDQFKETSVEGSFTATLTEPAEEK